MNKNKKIITAVVIIGVILIGGITFWNIQNGNNNSIKIGSILILSGEGATWGESARNGINMAIEEVNASGGINGKKLAVIHEDDGSDPKKAVSAFQKLTAVDGVKFIIGPNWSNTGLAVRDLATQNKVVLISPSLGVKEFNEGSEFAFNTWPHDFILSQNLADYVYKKGYRNVALFGAQDVWVKDQTNAFKNRFEQLGGKVKLLFEPVVTDLDVRSDVLKVKSDSTIDAVVATTDGYSITSVTAQKLKEFGVNLPQFDITLDRKIIADCKGACDGATFLTFLTPTKDFEEKYKAKYNREIEIGADSAYDAVMMLAEALRETNSTDADSVRQYLGSIKNYSGVSGNLVSDGKRAFTKDYVIKKIVNGVPIIVSE